jgi:hypothetical protein
VVSQPSLEVAVTRRRIFVASTLVVLLVGLVAWQAGEPEERAAEPVRGVGPTNLPAAAPQAQVFEVGGADGVRSLEGTCRDRTLPAALRVAALRRLEELGAPQRIGVAAALCQNEPPLVHDTAVAVLVRARSDTARAALEALDLRSQELARSISKGGDR